MEEKNEKNDMDTPEIKQKTNMLLFWTQRRYIMVFMLMLGQTLHAAFQGSMSIAIIPMTTNITDDAGSIVQVAEFDWNSKEQGVALSAIFYGHMIGQLPGALLAKRFNCAKIFGGATGLFSVAFILTPVFRNFHAIVALRAIQGLFSGVAAPIQMPLLAKWAPVHERSRMIMFATCGFFFGLVIGMQLSGIICDFLDWPSVFYIFGALGVVWYIFWFSIIKETPEKDTKITEEEKRLILDSIGNQGKRDLPIPWWSILTSVPVWAITVAFFATGWIGYVLLAHMPIFLNQLFHIKLGKTGFLSCLPYLINGFLSPFYGVLSDKLLSTKKLTVIQTRKLFTCGGFLIQIVCLLLLTYFMTPVTSVILLIVIKVSLSICISGFWVNCIDIAPQLSGILCAVSSTIATISGFAGPTLTGFIVQNGIVEEWQLVFYIATAVSLFGCVFYALFAQGTLQPWAVIPVESVNNEKPNLELQERLLTSDENKNKE